MSKPSRIHPVLGYIIALAIIVLGWELTSLILQSPAVPSPLTTFEVLSQELETLAPHFVISSYRVVASILIGTALAFPIALLLSRNEKRDAIFAHFLFLIYPIPKEV